MKFLISPHSRSVIPFEGKSYTGLRKSRAYLSSNAFRESQLFFQACTIPAAPRLLKPWQLASPSYASTSAARRDLSIPTPWSLPRSQHPCSLWRSACCVQPARVLPLVRHPVHEILPDGSIRSPQRKTTTHTRLASNPPSTRL